jgi:hypothetical protein
MAMIGAAMVITGVLISIYLMRRNKKLDDLVPPENKDIT